MKAASSSMHSALARLYTNCSTLVGVERVPDVAPTDAVFVTSTREPWAWMKTKPAATFQQRTDILPRVTARPSPPTPSPVRACGLGDMSAPYNGLHVNDLVQVDPCVVSVFGAVTAALVATHVRFRQEKICARCAAQLVLELIYSIHCFHGPKIPHRDQNNPHPFRFVVQGEPEQYVLNRLIAPHIVTHITWDFFTCPTPLGRGRASFDFLGPQYHLSRSSQCQELNVRAQSLHGLWVDKRK